MKQGVVYILASKRHGTLYIGVTSDLPRRMTEHENDVDPKSFTSRYGVKKLVWFEAFDRMDEAIRREKQMKRYKRAWKIELIEKDNPDWLPLHPVFGHLIRDGSADQVGE